MSDARPNLEAAPVRVLLGGSFDPVHCGHLALADAAHAYGASEVVWIPVAQSPFKSEGPQIEAADRLALLQVAIQNRVNERIDLCEWQRGGTSYTVDTLRSFAGEALAGRLALLMGEDSLADFLGWHEAEVILSLAELWVAPRVENGASSLAGHRESICGAHPAARIELLPFALQEARSTALRAQLAAGIDPGRALLPVPVMHEVIARGLYGCLGHAD